MDIQSKDTKHFEMEKLILKFSIELEEGLKECRELQGRQKIRHLPKSGPVSTSDHQEHIKAVQQVLDECRAQLVTHEKKFQDGEKQIRRLQDEVKAQQQQPKPEVQVGLPSEIQVAIETRFAQIEETLRKSQKQCSQWQGDSVKDAQAIETYPTSGHSRGAKCLFLLKSAKTDFYLIWIPLPKNMLPV